MPSCSVKNCPNNTRNSNKKDTGVSYFIFPKNPIRRSEWTTIIGQNRGEEFYKPLDAAYVCSEHFPPSDISTTAKGFKRLSTTAIPMLHLSNNLENEHFQNTDHVHDNSNLSQHSQSIHQVSSNVKQEPDFVFITSEKSNATQSCYQVISNVKQEPGSVFTTGESRTQQDNYEFNDCQEYQSHLSFLKLQYNDSEKEQDRPLSSLSTGSILDSPKETVLKQKLDKCKKLILNKNRCIDRLRKQNNRLIKKNISLKKAAPIRRRQVELKSIVEDQIDTDDHLPEHDKKKVATRCKNPDCQRKTHVFCLKCKIHLCITSENNCFRTFHQSS